ncbi:cytochrome P450 2J6-like isoform X1 [Polypterus senegalus]|uniref:cytochrome P450 2J6-like isoform X1 n=2 Tax=Polypterus senegalus TaxID=55291 RepID=UPI00196653E2|nr:cytochrome P450 2J6-like isoform X1 [Polypterus senegalus]XP_039591018.1 cytochrome P450 2J6-like isoform X1 [Polypterus senegalus]
MQMLQELLHLEGIGITECFIFLFVFLLISDYFWSKPPNNFPPGPPSLPFIGHLFHFDSKAPHTTLFNIAKKYGDVFSLRIGRRRLVVLSGYKIMKEAFVQNGDIYVDRPSFPLLADLTNHLGILASNGHQWREQRRFALSTLKYFGVGKKTLENAITEESRHLNENVKEKNGNPFDPEYLLHNAISNIICSLVFGHRFEYTDSRFQELLRLLEELLRLQGSASGRAYNVFPNLMKLLPGGHKTMFSNWAKVKAFVRVEIEQHKKHRNLSEPRDYIDCYLEEMEKCKDESAGFNEENLCCCTMDLFGAGTETTATTLRWALLYMAKYPHIQQKVQEEIDQVIGPSRVPSMEDRINMPYTYAVIHEVQRAGNVVPVSPPRMASKDTTLAGYSIPKGTVILPDLTSVLNDENEYMTPGVFNPQHFLDENGKFMKNETLIPFSIGKRACPGENLARMEIFLFFTSLLQAFTFHCPNGQQLTLETKPGITLGPKAYKICALSR